MPINRNTLVIGASCLALVSLVLFQVKWMQHSRNLLEEQFDNKVNMALCSAVDKMADGPSCTLIQPSCSRLNNLAPGHDDKFDDMLDAHAFEFALKDALDSYNIDLAYQIRVMDKDSLASVNPSYCCSLSPLVETNSYLLNINFPDKSQYVLSKMGLMIIASIMILFFISLVFILANYYLLRQKRIGERNIDFFNNMAHEFRTPLSNITLATKLLTRKRNELNDDRFIGILQQESRKMMDQVERVLDLAKLENGEYRLQFEEVDLSALVNQVIQEMDLQIRERQGVIHLQVDQPDIRINADPLHLSNAFRNLIDNSLKYTRNAPEITIRLDQQNDREITVQYEDNGIGISKSDQAIIFDKFHRISTGDRHDQKGFGLGLSYVKKIIEMHQGMIRTFSELNKGTRFDLVLPVG